MEMEVPKEQSDSIETSSDKTRGNATTEHHPSLNDEAIQAKYRAAYFEQLRRGARPGCGEAEVL